MTIPAGSPPVDGSGAHPRRNRSSTAVRLALLQLGVLAVILAAVVLSLVRTFADQSRTATVHLLTSEVQGFQRAADARPPNQSLAAFSRSYLRTHPTPAGGLVLIALPRIGILGTTGSSSLARSLPVSTLLARPPSRSIQSSVVVGNRTYEVLAVPVTAGSTTGTIVVADAQDSVRDNEGRVLHLAILEALVALVACGLAGYLLLRGLLRRVGRITETAAGLGQGEMDRRLGDQGTDDEVGRLAETFDAMADRVAAAMATQRRMLADVSHQLRTPLTVARGHLEVLDRGGATDPSEVRDTISLVVDELDHMSVTIERLLQLGRALEPDFVALAPVDLRSLLTDLLESGRVIADRDWELSEIPDVTLNASLDKLRGALLNLIDNAVKATRPGDLIRIESGLTTDGWLEIAVLDSGPGIPIPERERALDRFGRLADTATSGTGLGLAIVRAVAEAHGGRVEISDAPGGGAKVAILLPPQTLLRGVTD
ncbi:MAG TPA: HAMP domain-containing sensor histidine kinase [Mycobacteriales bacterium]|nr:HAMP domain-containing sensor histidine kinase [Mycobacteriales bacterium]